MKPFNDRMKATTLMITIWAWNHGFTYISGPSIEDRLKHFNIQSADFRMAFVELFHMVMEFERDDPNYDHRRAWADRKEKPRFIDKDYTRFKHEFNIT